MSMKRLGYVLLGFVVVACGDGPDSPPPDPAPTPTATVKPATGQVSSTDSLADAPTILWADHEDAPPAGRPTTAADAARWHLGRFTSYYRLTAAQVAGLELFDLHDTGRGAIIARFSRAIDGVEVLNERISVAMDRSLDVVALTGYVTGDLPAAAKAGRSRDAFALDAPRAVAAAMTDLAGVPVSVGDFEAPVDTAGGYRALRLAPAGMTRTASRSTEPARGKPVFFRQGPGTLIAAYYVEADLGDDADGRPRSFSYVIAADDGRVLDKHDLTAYDHPVTYRVFADDSGLFRPWDGPQGTDPTPHPTAIPDGFEAALIPSQLVTLSSLTAVGVNDQWLPPGATETLGNNVDVYTDLNAPDGFTPGSNDFRGTTSAADTFNYAYDTSLDANALPSQRQAAMAQLFFNINWFHDWYYAAGFTETAGNGQFSNYGRGGIENDGLRGEAQDFGGFNNANMSTPADGGRPRMQMFLWTRPTVLNVTVTAPPALAGTYTNIGTANFGPLNFSLSGEIVRANPIDGCTPLVGDYTGKIVFVDRGGAASCNGFAGKAERVQTAGGIGVIIANVATSSNPTVPPQMGGTPAFPITIGVVSMNLADGDLFRNQFTLGATVTGSVTRTVKLLDGDIDNQVVAHEWGHYISNRLVFNSTGLQANMSRGLGEGWADFHTMLMQVREEDTLNPTNTTWQGVYNVGAYATSANVDSFYYGIRRYPYSTDQTKDPLSFRHISDGNPLPVSPPPRFDGVHSQVHNTGEIWATMLWECYASLLRDTLGGTPRLTFDQARDRMRDYVVAAYKMTPANPTLLEARDAVLLAALLNDPIDHQLCGAAYATRGAGVFASGPPRGENTNTPVVESFAWGPSVSQTAGAVADTTSACGPDNILDDGEAGTVTVTFRNTGASATPAFTATVSSTTPGIGFPGGASMSVPAIPRAGTGTATIAVNATGIADNSPISFTVDTPDLGAGTTSVTHTFAGDADEVAGNSTLDNAERSINVWASTSSVPLPAEAIWHRVQSSLSNRLYNARSPEIAQTSEMMSPLLSVPPGGSLSLAFNHRHSFERDAATATNFDAGVLEYSLDNGVTWLDVTGIAGSVGYNGTIAAGNPLAGRTGYVGTSTGYPGFLARTVNFGTAFAGQLVRLRFRVSADTAVGSPGWDVDDIQITGASAPPFHGLIAHSTTCNHQPIASAGANQTVGEFGPSPTFTPTIVILDGSASNDADGNTLSYQWTQLSGPAVTLNSSTIRFPSFTAPQIPRTPGSAALVFQLVVSDGTVASAAKTTQVTVVNVNRPPIANAGPPQTVDPGELVTLDSSGSSDPDSDDVITRLWTPPAGITLSDNTAVNPTFTAPAVTVDTPFVFNLAVSDGLLITNAQVTITVEAPNLAPIADAGPDQNVTEQTLVTLNGTGSSDPNGDPLTYQWTPPAGITLSDPTAASPTFTAPEVGPTGQQLTFALVVTDPDLVPSAPDTVVITVLPSGVVWTNAVGVTATGNDLVKTGGTSAWAAGASTVDNLVGDGYAEWTTGESNTAKMAGLSNGDAVRSYVEIDYAFYMAANGNLFVYENGVNRGLVGTYVAGDLFRVQVTSGVVTYRKNGVTVFTSAVAPTFPLLIDTSFYTPGGTLDDAFVVRQAATWQNAVGVAVTGNSLTKTDPAVLWNAGASSLEVISGNGYAQWTTAEANTAKMAGLSVGDANRNFVEIDYAIYMAANGFLYVYENGVNRGQVGTYVAGDSFRVVVTGGVVTYTKNGGLIYTSAVAPSFPLRVDTSLRTPGATINGVLVISP